MTIPPPAPTPKPTMAPRRAALIAVTLVFFDSLLGQLATIPNLEPWYVSLQKPGFTPPNGLFGPVWTLLYALMALAFWRILIAPRSRTRQIALALFLAQLALNAVWSFAFFAAQSPLLGLIDIVPQWALIVAAAIAFWRLDRLAGLCLVPAALWVGYASLLNLWIWRLN